MKILAFCTAKLKKNELFKKWSRKVNVMIKFSKSNQIFYNWFFKIYLKI